MLDWTTFKKLKENANDDSGIREPEYEQDHGHDESDKNDQGGLDPANHEELARYKHADLITLPADVKGTNCGNCKFVKQLTCGQAMATAYD